MDPYRMTPDPYSTAPTEGRPYAVEPEPVTTTEVLTVKMGGCTVYVQRLDDNRWQVANQQDGLRRDWPSVNLEVTGSEGYALDVAREVAVLQWQQSTKQCAALDEWDAAVAVLRETYRR